MASVERTCRATRKLGKAEVVEYRGKGKRAKVEFNWPDLRKSWSFV